MLLLRARLSTDTKSAVGSHAISWLTLAAYQGDTLAQADLAHACFYGEFVKQDFIEAYKWGALATQGTPTVPGSNNVQTTRDAAILKMSAAQIADAKQRVATFIPHLPARSELPESSWVKQITLTGLSGTANCPLAVINCVTFGVGESGVVSVGGKAVTVRCLQIRNKSVLVQIKGLDMPRELTLEN